MNNKNDYFGVYSKEYHRAQESMKELNGIGVLDERLKEARERGLTYAELQKQKSLEKIRKGEL